MLKIEVAMLSFVVFCKFWEDFLNMLRTLGNPCLMNSQNSANLQNLSGYGCNTTTHHHKHNDYYQPYHRQHHDGDHHYHGNDDHHDHDDIYDDNDDHLW